jgi:hypothetical protein
MAASDNRPPDSPYGTGASAAEQKTERNLERVARSGYQPAAKSRYFRFRGQNKKEKVTYPPMKFSRWLRVLGWRYLLAVVVVFLDGVCLDQPGRHAVQLRTGSRRSDARQLPRNPR